MSSSTKTLIIVTSLMILISANFLPAKDISPNIALNADYADPTIVKAGDYFYMTNSSWDYVPGLLVWRSKDLKKWERIGHALKKHGGYVLAPDIAYHDNKFYIYYPADGTNWVVTADNPEGPWSEPINLKVGFIDPGHLACQQGKRYLYLSMGNMIELTQDGLATKGKLEKIYDGWKFPDNWIVECFCDESPKLTYRKGYYYLNTAQGGTAGPATSHMVVCARSKSPTGPWENSPYNPTVHTYSSKEKWWSKGHGTIFEGDAGQWYIVYHGYEKGHLPLGRQTLIEPIEWTKDLWYKTKRDTKVEPQFVNNNNVTVESDNFNSDKLNLQWQFSGIRDTDQFTLADGKLKLKSQQNQIRVLHAVVGQHNYATTVELERQGPIECGLIVHYDNSVYSGIGFDGENLFNVHKGKKMFTDAKTFKSKIYLKLVLQDYNLSMSFSHDGKNWQHYPNSLEVSGLHHNVFGGFKSLKIGVYCKGEGELIIDNFQFAEID